MSECERILPQDWDGQAPSLKPFQPADDALFHNIFNGRAQIPCIPKYDKPSLLLFDLTNEAHKETEAYKYIDTSRKKGPSAIYGTSGAGKTRRGLEYLSQNYGFYFVVDNKDNPGSGDVRGLLHVIEDKLVRHDSGADPIRLSEDNLKAVLKHLKVLVAARITVFHCLKKIRDLSCYEWLLIQLFPEEFLGKDVFKTLTIDWLKKDLPIDLPEGTTNMACFVDEAQTLKDKLPHFFLSSDGKSERSAYKAFVQGFTGLSEEIPILGYPVFSGTGLSLHALQSETKSVMAKPLLHEPVFTGMKPLAVPEITAYLQLFLNLEGVGSDLIEHVAKWLCGRPRWAATFVETFLQQKSRREGYAASSGKFTEHERPIIQAIDRYVERVTTDANQSDRRLSWTLGESSAYAAVSKLYTRRLDNNNQWLVISQLKDASFKFALSGSAMTVRDTTARLIEYGIASVVTRIGKGDEPSDYVDCRIDEPLIVQSCINFFGIDKLLEVEMALKRGESEKGNGFEHFLLPAIQGNFSKVMIEQLKVDIGDFGDYSVPKLSSYGVLARECSGIDETLNWLSNSMDARFEGIVEPFCFPDESIGPDLMFFLRNLVYEMRLCVVQGKFKYKVKNQVGALRTIEPKQFYQESRKLGRNSSPASVMTEAQRETWSTIQETLFKMKNAPAAQNVQNGRPMTRANKSKTKTRVKRERTAEVVRMMVQFPATRTMSANPGLVPFDEKSTCGPQCKRHKHDAFLIIDGNNAKTLFGDRAVDLLEHVKSRSGDNDETQK